MCVVRVHELLPPVMANLPPRASLG